MLCVTRIKYVVCIVKAKRFWIGPSDSNLLVACGIIPDPKQMCWPPYGCCFLTRSVFQDDGGKTEQWDSKLV
jgi:hypothetical protein